MDYSEKYVAMCKEAGEIQEEWMRMPKEKRYGTLIRYRTFLGIVVPTNKPLEFKGLSAVIPETLALRTWLKEKETLIVTAVELEPYDDKGTPLFHQDQLQEILNYPFWKLVWDFEEFTQKTFEELTEKMTDKDCLENKTMEQLWLAFVMKEKYNKMWDDEKKKWREK